MLPSFRPSGFVRETCICVTAAHYVSHLCSPCMDIGKAPRQPFLASVVMKVWGMKHKVLLHLIEAIRQDANTKDGSVRRPCPDAKRCGGPGVSTQQKSVVEQGIGPGRPNPAHCCGVKVVANVLRPAVVRE